MTSFNRIRSKCNKPERGFLKHKKTHFHRQAKFCSHFSGRKCPESLQPVISSIEVATGLNSRPEPGPKSSTQGPARPEAHKHITCVYPNYTRKFLEITMVDCRVVSTHLSWQNNSFFVYQLIQISFTNSFNSFILLLTTHSTNSRK